MVVLVCVWHAKCVGFTLHRIFSCILQMLVCKQQNIDIQRRYITKKSSKCFFKAAQTQ